MTRTNFPERNLLTGVLMDEHISLCVSQLMCAGHWIRIFWNSNVRLMNKTDRNHVETIKKLIKICPHVSALARKNHET